MTIWKTDLSYTHIHIVAHFTGCINFAICNKTKMIHTLITTYTNHTQIKLYGYDLGIEKCTLVFERDDMGSNSDTSAVTAAPELNVVIL